MSLYHGSGFEEPPSPFTGPFGCDPEIPFADVLNEQKVADAIDELDFGKRDDAIFTPLVTFWTFMLQLISANQSCRNALLGLSVALVEFDRKSCAIDTAAYCRARGKIPMEIIRKLTLESAEDLRLQIPEEWKYHGRDVKIVDGTTISLPDTQANRDMYPQPETQKPGLGFPKMRMLLIFCFATGMLCDAAFGPYSGKQTGESALLQELLDNFSPGDIMLADRYFCSYFLVAMAQARRIDVVYRKHQRRKTDFRGGRRLGKQDHEIVWKRPAKPKWMDEETYASMPKTITVREVEVRIDEPGCRTKCLVVVTTLLDPEKFSKDQIIELYGKRWLAELDIRDLKTTLQMDRLSCKSPFMVEKEIWMHLLSYNMVRKTIAQSACLNDLTPRQYSFTATLHGLEKHWMSMTRADCEKRRKLLENLLTAIAGERVGNRPGRCEPRAVKYRGKPHKRLTKPREQARAELLSHQCHSSPGNPNYD